MFFGLAIAAILVGQFWTYSYTAITDTLNAPPSTAHPFGTNTIGGDVFAQVMRGTLQDIEIALVVALLATVIGTLVGAVAGFYGGRVDSVLMRFVDLILVIPVLVVLIVLAHIVAKQTNNWFWLAIIIGAAVVDLRRATRAGRLPDPPRARLRRGLACARAPSTGGSSPGTCCPTPWARSS